MSRILFWMSLYSVFFFFFSFSRVWRFLFQTMNNFRANKISFFKTILLCYVMNITSLVLEKQKWVICWPCGGSFKTLNLKHLKMNFCKSWRCGQVYFSDFWCYIHITQTSHFHKNNERESVSLWWPKRLKIIFIF